MKTRAVHRPDDGGKRKDAAPWLRLPGGPGNADGQGAGFGVCRLRTRRVLVLGGKVKPFDLSKAQAGEPIVLVLSNEHDTIPVRLVGMLTDGRYVVERRADSGVYFVEVATDYRLRMAPKKRTVWITLFEDGDAAWVDEPIHVSKGCVPTLAGCIPVEIEA